MTRAEKLARWTQLPFEIIKLLYTAEAVAGTRDWKTLKSTTTAAGDRTALENAIIAWAFEEAERQAFILPLAIRISRVERERGRAKEDVAQLLTEVSDGVMQAVTNRAAGMMEFAILPDLVRIGEASAYVEAGVSQLGTALLVAPDLVLTSAHVVLDTDGNGSFIGTRLKPDLKFTFMPDRRDPSRTPVVRAALGTVPVAGALPHGRPPNILERNLNAAAAQESGLRAGTAVQRRNACPVDRYQTTGFRRKGPKVLRHRVPRRNGTSIRRRPRDPRYSRQRPNVASRQYDCRYVRELLHRSARKSGRLA